MATQTYGRYEVIRELGRGGMGTVYLAYDPVCTRQVVVKVLPPQFTHDPQFRTRFVQEAKVIAALEHPYIVPVYDYGEEGTQPFIVMRYMPGGTLADRMQGRSMPLAEITPIIQRLAEALDEAHSQKIIHRDLKPANVLFDARGKAFLSDFGIAKVLEASAVFTGTAVVGTPTYMSPEQAVGDQEIDCRSDIYALGIILYEMLTGHPPYRADTPVRLMLKHVNEPVPTLNTLQLGVPAGLSGLLTCALAKSPEERYATAGTMAAELAALTNTAVGLTPVQPPKKTAAIPAKPPTNPPPKVVRTPTPPPAQVVRTPTPPPAQIVRTPTPPPAQVVRTPTPPPATMSAPSPLTPPPMARPKRWLWTGIPLAGLGLCLLTIIAGTVIAWSVYKGQSTSTPTASVTIKVLTATPSRTATPTFSPTRTLTQGPPTFTPTITVTSTPTATCTRTKKPYIYVSPTWTPTPTSTDRPPDPPKPSDTLAPP